MVEPACGWTAADAWAPGIPHRPTVAIMMTGQMADVAALVAGLLVDHCEGIMLDASPAGVRTMGRLARAGAVQAVIDLAPTQDLQWCRDHRSWADCQGISAHRGQDVPYVAILRKEGGGEAGAGEAMALARALIHRLNMRRGPVSLMVEQGMAGHLPPGGSCELVELPAGACLAALAAAGAQACLAGLRGARRQEG